jgi:hydroxyacylglutathione hydrolase
MVLPPKDTESASHGDTAAIPVVLKTYDFPGVKIVQFNLAVLSQYSYMVVSNKDAMVVDPARDIGAYVDLAEKEGWSIKGVLLTHSNADFVAGHIELLKAFGCPIYQSKESGALYKIHGLSDGEAIPWGEATLKFLSTPGHTPDGMCALVYGKDDKTTPVAILTGDTLFVGSIGRPDLMGGAMAAATLAGMGYDTWTQKLSKLDDRVVVLPGHGAGSLCGAHLRDEPSSTIGTERATNPYLQHKGRNDFITAVLEGLPMAPQYFKHNAKMNREGPPAVDWNAPPPEKPPLDPSLSDTERFYVVDLRDAKSFAAGHIPNAVNIALRGRLETWVGIMVPWGSKLVLCGSPEEVQEARMRLHRVGYDVAGALSFEDWAKAKQAVNKNEVVSPQELHKQMLQGNAPVIVDVRLPNEWMGLRIGNVLNMPLNQLSDMAFKLDPDMPVVTVCNSAYRSSLGIGLLERKGFKKVSSMEGGGEAWIQAGLPVIQAEAAGDTASATPKRVIKLPDLIEPAQLKRMLMDLPGTFDLVDIRPAGHFEDYSLPGAKNVDLGDLINNPVYLTGAGPLVIVDRDGSLAMAAGGILAQKTERPIKVLYGGLSAYWNRAEMGKSFKTAPVAPKVYKKPRATPAQPVPPTPKKADPPRPKSAGC